MVTVILVTNCQMEESGVASGMRLMLVEHYRIVLVALIQLQETALSLSGPWIVLSEEGHLIRMPLSECQFIYCSLIFHCGHNVTRHLKHLPLTYENLDCNLKLLSEINLSPFRYFVRVFYDINRKETKMSLVPKVFLGGGSEKVQCQQTQTSGVRQKACSRLHYL